MVPRFGAQVGRPCALSASSLPEQFAPPEDRPDPPCQPHHHVFPRPGELPPPDLRLTPRCGAGRGARHCSSLRGGGEGQCPAGSRRVEGAMTVGGGACEGNGGSNPYAGRDFAVGAMCVDPPKAKDGIGRSGNRAPVRLVLAIRRPCPHARQAEQSETGGSCQASPEARGKQRPVRPGGGRRAPVLGAGIEHDWPCTVPGSAVP